MKKIIIFVLTMMSFNSFALHDLFWMREICEGAYSENKQIQVECLERSIDSYVAEEDFLSYARNICAPSLVHPFKGTGYRQKCFRKAAKLSGDVALQRAVKKCKHFSCIEKLFEN